jgi:hypothetical protein
MSELVFEVVQEADGGFTDGDTWEELRKNVVEATAG